MCRTAVSGSGVERLKCYTLQSVTDSSLGVRTVTPPLLCIWVGFSIWELFTYLSLPQEVVANMNNNHLGAQCPWVSEECYNFKSKGEKVVSFRLCYWQYKCLMIWRILTPSVGCHGNSYCCYQPTWKSEHNVIIQKSFSWLWLMK